MSDPGPRPELTWLPVDRLDADAAYQRSLDTPRGKRLIEAIATNFRWAAFQAILASPNGAERWWIIDGQHRVAGARRVPIGLVPAVVVHDIDRAAQAAAFVAANRDRVAVSAQAMFHARVAAGDADAVTLARLCDTAGIEVVRSNQAASVIPAGKTAAVPALLRMLKLYGESRTGSAIAAVAEVFGQDRGALRSPFFMAAARFLAEGGGEQELRLALTRTGWRDLEAVGLGLGGYTMVADIVNRLRAAVAPSRPAPAESRGPQPPLRVGDLPAPPGANKGFQDDPRARRDPGSPGRLSPTLGHSATGSSLADV